MNTEMAKVLTEMREQLRAELAEGEEAWGPDSDAQGDSSGGQPGSTGASNNSNIWDAFDLYIGDMVDDLLEEYDLSEEEAIDFVFSVADDLAAEGKIPPIPTEENDAKAVANWLGVTGSMGFERMVLDAAEEAAEG